MIKHIFCDLDGTLYHNGINEDDANAIKNIQNEGVVFNIATGRIFSQAVKMTSNNNVNINGHYICENGAFIHDTNNDLVYKGTIDDNLVKKVANRFESESSHLYFKYDEKVVLIEDLKYTNNYNSEYIIDKEFLNKDSFDNLVGNIGVMSDDIEELNRVELYLKSEFSEVLDIYFSSQHTLNIVSKGVSKREGIKHICNILNINENEIATIGDSPNDINMIEGVKYGFAMENARDSVKAKANYIVKNVKEAIEVIKDINQNNNV